MARNTIFIEAPPSAVWAILADPYAYPQWVVGADRTLKADDSWPVPGSRFKVRLALGPKDHTTSVEVDPEKRIVLDAGSSYFGPARVTIELQPSGDGTHITMLEDPVGKMAPLRKLPPIQWALRLRNTVGLRRMRDLVLKRAPQAVT
jgi:uncharacterized protein YndB with AHSA1/START domain